jgi:hypothetical protein
VLQTNLGLEILTNVSSCLIWKLPGVAATKAGRHSGHLQRGLFDSVYSLHVYTTSYTSTHCRLLLAKGYSI